MVLAFFDFTFQPGGRAGRKVLQIKLSLELRRHRGIFGELLQIVPNGGRAEGGRWGGRGWRRKSQLLKGLVVYAEESRLILQLPGITKGFQQEVSRSDLHFRNSMLASVWKTARVKAEVSVRLWNFVGLAEKLGACGNEDGEKWADLRNSKEEVN